MDCWRPYGKDQDVTHRVSPPSHLARRPRYSLVWKLVFMPKVSDASPSSYSFVSPSSTTPSSVSVGGGGGGKAGPGGGGGGGGGGSSGGGTIVRPEWGVPSPIGSAAKLAAIMAALLRSGTEGKRRRE